MQSYTVTSEMAGYGRKQMPKRILTIAVPVIAAEIFVIQWNAHSGEHFKLKSFVLAAVSGVVAALLAELCEVGRNYPYTLVVSDDYIKAVYPNREKSIQKNEIRSVTETEGNAFSRRWSGDFKIWKIRNTALGLHLNTEGPTRIRIH